MRIQCNDHDNRKFGPQHFCGRYESPRAKSRHFNLLKNSYFNPGICRRHIQTKLFVSGPHIQQLLTPGIAHKTLLFLLEIVAHFLHPTYVELLQVLHSSTFPSFLSLFFFFLLPLFLGSSFCILILLYGSFP